MDSKFQIPNSKRSLRAKDEHIAHAWKKILLFGAILVLIIIWGNFTYNLNQTNNLLLAKLKSKETELEFKANELTQQQSNKEEEYEAIINALKIDHESQKTELTQKMTRQNAEWKSKYTEQTHKNQLELENMKSDIILGQHITQQKHRLNTLYDELTHLYESIKQDVELYNHDINEINSEYKHIYQYHPDQLSAESNIYSIILLGETGHHKSTLGNRLCGDISQFAESTEFNTSTASASCTKNFTKRIVKNLYSKTISVVDTPGFHDTDDADRINAENLVSYLRGSGGINAFVWVTKETKFTTYYGNSLEKVQNLLGKGFWKHVIFVRSMVNNGTPAMRDKDIYASQLRNSVRFSFGLDDSYKLPIIPLHTFYYYKKPIIEEFISAVPVDKFECDKISSPMTKLVENAEDKSRNLYRFSLPMLNTKMNEFNLLCDNVNAAVRKMKLFDESSSIIYLGEIMDIQTKANKYNNLLYVELDEIIDFSNNDKETADVDIGIIDFANRDKLEFISDLNKAEINDIIKQCDIPIHKMEEYGKYLHSKHPDLMVTNFELCQLINSDIANCKPCTPQIDSQTDMVSDDMECLTPESSTWPPMGDIDQANQPQLWLKITIIVLVLVIFIIIGIVAIYVIKQKQKQKEMSRHYPDVHDIGEYIANPTDDNIDECENDQNMRSGAKDINTEVVQFVG